MAKKRFPWQSIVTAAGSIVGLAGFVVGLLEIWPLWISVSSVLLLVACVLYLTSRWWISPVKVVHAQLDTFTPWLIIALLVVSVLILHFVRPRRGPVAISFDSGKAAVFNSWQHQKHRKHIEASGGGERLGWTIADNGRTGSFQYAVDGTLSPSEGASSGAYVTFYEQPCDRLQLRTVTFRCRITGASSAADVGIRLAVDNPKATGDREMIAYEIDSLAKYGALGDTWTKFELPTSAFKQVRYEPPFPAGLDENTINKIVFFIDNRIAERRHNATVWVSDIEFRP